MSNFQTLSLISEGNTSTAPSIFVASTEDSLAEITTAGYMNDLGDAGVVKPNDVLYINYDDLSEYPLNVGEDATLGEFQVSYSAPNWTIASVLTGLGQAAAKAVTDNTKSYVASVDGAPASYTAGTILFAGDTNGSIGADSGYTVDNLLLVASVAITAAQFKALYSAPKALITAPGANKLIVVHRMELIMTYVSANYAVGGVVAAQYDSTVHGGGVPATNTEAAADFFAAASTTFGFNGSTTLAPFSTSVNKGLYLSCATADFTTGDSTFVCKVYYRIVATA